VEAAFLELGQPDLAGAVSRLATEGVRHIVVIPYFLTLGIHLERDLPALVAKLMAAHAGVEIEVTKPLEGHPALLRVLLDRAGEALIP
jgi:sirohydrochlorin ferrochelatase